MPGFWEADNHCVVTRQAPTYVKSPYRAAPLPHLYPQIEDRACYEQFPLANSSPPLPGYHFALLSVEAMQPNTDRM